MLEHLSKYEFDDDEFGDEYADETEIAERTSTPHGWRVQLEQMMNSEQ